jgi:hypothetical protein
VETSFADGAAAQAPSRAHRGHARCRLRRFRPCEPSHPCRTIAPCSGAIIEGVCEAPGGGGRYRCGSSRCGLPTCSHHDLHLGDPRERAQVGGRRATGGRVRLRADGCTRHVCRRHGKRIRGHPLLWHEQLPAWLTNGSFTPRQLTGVIRRYVQTVVSRYRGRIAEWDVVNEPLDEHGRLRRNLFLRTLGIGYIDIAFRAARRADRAATLVLHQIGAEPPASASRALQDLVKRLKRRGVPIDGVGLQPSARRIRVDSGAVRSGVRGLPSARGQGRHNRDGHADPRAIEAIQAGSRLPGSSRGLRRGPELHGSHRLGCDGQILLAGAGGRAAVVR